MSDAVATTRHHNILEDASFACAFGQKKLAEFRKHAAEIEEGIKGADIPNVCRAAYIVSLELPKLSAGDPLPQTLIDALETVDANRGMLSFYLALSGDSCLGFAGVAADAFVNGPKTREQTEAIFREAGRTEEEIKAAIDGDGFESVQANG